MELINNASLKDFTTFGVDAHCDHLYRVQDVEELRLAVQYLERPLILGGGSNILPVEDIHRNVLKIELSGIDILSERDDVLIRVAAGEVWQDVVMWAIARNMGGIENLSLIPGTMGAAPMQNIGAYGVELESVFDHLVALEVGTGNERMFTKEECAFGYRDSVFKQGAKDRFVITDVMLRLTYDHKINSSYGAIQDVLRERYITHPTIRDVSDAVIAIRQSKLPDPGQIGNAGSFFKNPLIPVAQYEALKGVYPDIPGFPSESEIVKVPAGWLIEKAGWKGKRLGNVGCYEKQALVLVNQGGATGAEVWNLALEIMDSVKQKFGISLSPEVNVWRS